MTEVHLDSGCYAADTLDPAERAAFEAHLVDCGGCRREAVEFAETSAELARLAAARPPSAMRGALLAAIRTVAPLPSLASAPDEANRGR